MLDSQGQRFLFDQMPVAISICRESDGLYVDVNVQWSQLTGLSSAEVLGRCALDVGMWRDAEQRQQALFALGDTGQLRGVEISFQRPDGRTSLFSVDISR